MQHSQFFTLRQNAGHYEVVGNNVKTLVIADTPEKAVNLLVDAVNLFAADMRRKGVLPCN